jgi:hypothetical protein
MGVCGGCRPRYARRVLRCREAHIVGRERSDSEIMNRMGPWVTDLRDFLDPEGRLWCDLPTVALYIVTIVASVSGLGPGRLHDLGIRCRRRPGRRACPGGIFAKIDSSNGEIRW